MTEARTQVEQVELNDVSKTGRRRDWDGMKVRNQYYAAALEDIDPERAKRVGACGEILTFAQTADGLRLRGAWLCRDRLCPLCQWRRSLKVGAQMRQIMDKIKADGHNYKYVLLTLTVKNVQGEELSQTLDELGDAFKRLTQRRRVKNATTGWYKAIEIVHDTDEEITWAKYKKAKKYYDKNGLSVGDSNPNYDMYHPHIHAIFAVPAGYFSGGRYINQAEWTSMWQDALRVDYTPSVDVRKIKGDTSAAVAEVAKYAIKSDDYIVPNDWDMTVDTVKLLTRVLANRRFLGYSGIFRDIARQLRLKSVEDDADLININEEAPSEAAEQLLSFVWYSGYRKYLKA